MNKWEELDKEEKAVAKRLEDVEDGYRAIEQAAQDFAAYQTFSRADDELIWEVSVQSRYRARWESNQEERKKLQKQAAEELEEWLDKLKKEEKALIEQREDLYQAKRRAFYDEEEERKYD